MDTMVFFNLREREANDTWSFFGGFFQILGAGEKSHDLACSGYTHFSYCGKSVFIISR